MSKNKIIRLEWADIKHFVESASALFSKKDLSAIIGIIRGGIIPAIWLSNTLDIPIYFVKSSLYTSQGRIIGAEKPIVDNLDVPLNVLRGYQVLLVDDFYNSGETLKEVSNLLKDIWVHKAVIVTKQPEVCYKRNIFYSDVINEDELVVFPWERE